MAAIDSAYQYYLTTYGNSSVSRYDTHKKSQLRDTYNKIVKTNKDSPLFKIKNLGEAQKYAIDIKEHVRNIQHVAESLSDRGQGIEKAFSKKVAQSSDESIVTAEYVGTDDDTAGFFDIEVKNLASAQSNIGTYLPSNRLDFSRGTYSFDLNTTLNSYEFQFNVEKNDTNQSVQEKIAQLINDSKIGMTADILRNEKGQSALRVSSKQTGLSEEEDYRFQILPSANTQSIQAMKVLGIDEVSKAAENAVFVLNGTEYASTSNEVTINNNLELTLNGVSQNGSSFIRFKTDADAVADNVNKLVDAYNQVIRIGHLHSDTQNSTKLITDMSGAAKDYRYELESIGLSIDENNFLHVDRNLLTDAAAAPDASENFSILNEFKNSLNTRATQASINPMNYVNKLLVAYKNPGKNFATPYITSIYSGMMLDRYC